MKNIVNMKFLLILSLVIMSIENSNILRSFKMKSTSTKQNLILDEKKLESFMNNYKMNKDDNVSFSQAEGAVQEKLDFDVDIDMEKHIISGLVRIHYKCVKETNFMGLDIRDLQITAIKDSDKSPLKFYILKNKKNTIGDGLIVKLNSNCQVNKDSFLDVSYSTVPNSLGIHFSDSSVLHANQKLKYSFLYTHGEAIYGRSFFPCQDTPSLKIKTSAKIRIKEPYTVLFSGEFVSNKKLDNSVVEFSFNLDKPIPTYLVTFSAGVIEKKTIPNSRCEVWGEKEALKWADESFKHCEDYLRFYETYRPFAFNKMTFLVVPDDFPFSGMENPYVTYITEAVLAKDMSYTNTIAHEIVHFWSGNLVTNKNWNSFWLNEGITTYMNRKAFRVVHGDEVFFSELYSGLFKLELALKDLKKNKKLDSSFRSLYPRIVDDPYITFSRIPYEKGSFFMYYVETMVGDKTMHKIMSDYFNQFAFKSLDSDTFIDFLKSKILEYSSEGKKIINDIKWDEWMHGTEMIPVDLNITSNKIQNFKKEVQVFKNGEKSIEELNSIFSAMKISEKVRVIKEIVEDLDKLSDKAKNQIRKFVENENLFNEHVTVKSSKSILQAHLIKDPLKRKEYLLNLIENLKFYKVLHLKKVFSMLKEIDPDKATLNKILSKYHQRFNPLTIQRIKELIDI